MAQFRRSSGIPELSDYRKYRPYLRADFRYQCAYCELTEAYLRSEDSFGIDHFRPQSTFPELVTRYTNLYYACNQCNR